MSCTYSAMCESPTIFGRGGAAVSSAANTGSAAAARSAIRRIIRTDRNDDGDDEDGAASRCMRLLIELVDGHQPNDFLLLERALGDEQLVDLAEEAVAAHVLRTQAAAEPDRAASRLRSAGG